jgi:hypothetical protein
METFKDPVNNINTTNYTEGKKMNTLYLYGCNTAEYFVVLV